MTDEINQGYLRAKLAAVQRARVERKKKRLDRSAERLPPGQVLTERFPILDLGVRPIIPPEQYALRLFGEVTEEKMLSYDDLLTLPASGLTADFHCVTRWSRYDVKWVGVTLQDMMAVVSVLPNAEFLIAHCKDGYTTNMRLDEVLEYGALVAYELEGERPVPRLHGGPVRLVVPELYGWKSAKFLIGLEFSQDDQPGFWEVRGYHNHGDPWREERFS